MPVSSSPRWLLDLIGQNQANADVTHNLAIVKLDAMVGHFIVINQTTAAQPASPTSGDCYLIASGATGSQWAGNDGKIAYYASTYGGWLILTPINGSTMYDAGTDTLYVLKAGGWTVVV